MEKDFFKDRPLESTEHNKIKIGMEVFICEKIMQPYAETIDDLTKVTVTDILTKQDVHPRGQKVRGMQYLIDGDGYKIPYKEKVGRIVYLCNGDYILTNKGWKKA